MSEREGLIKTDELIELAKTLDGAAIVQLKKQELDYLIARVGLQGTLWGAWALSESFEGGWHCRIIEVLPRKLNDSTQDNSQDSHRGLRVVHTASGARIKG